MLKTDVHDHSIYQIMLNELKHLVETLGISVIHEFVQSRHRPFAKFYIGSGKVKQIQRYLDKNNVDLVVFYNLLRSSQKINLIRALSCDVVDRYEVTLEIFEKMASDNLSKLQIEAARLEKLAPYFKLEANMRYRNERPFFRSMGEYAFHSQLREITRRQAQIRKRIDTLVKENRHRIVKRRELGFPIVCISGYYNAGKTSLFNALTGEKKPVSSQPFTTLSSKYQRRYINSDTTILFIDTIGFVLGLDPRLIKSFELNLEDIRNADLVLLMFDINESNVALRLKLVEGIRLLNEFGVPRNRIMFVFNKIDLDSERAGKIVENLDINRFNIPWIPISAKHRTNFENLLNLIEKRLKETGFFYNREINSKFLGKNWIQESD